MPTVWRFSHYDETDGLAVYVDDQECAVSVSNCIWAAPEYDPTELEDFKL